MTLQTRRKEQPPLTPRLPTWLRTKKLSKLKNSERRCIAWLSKVENTPISKFASKLSKIWYFRLRHHHITAKSIASKMYTSQDILCSPTLLQIPETRSCSMWVGLQEEINLSNFKTIILRSSNRSSGIMISSTSKVHFWVFPTHFQSLPSS